MKPFILWGTANSLYTGKTRSYLIKKGLPYRELYPSHPDFRARIVPVVKRSVVPVLETPEGEIVQDTDDIIEYLERRFPENSMSPKAPLQQTIALLINAFASEYLLATAMHYRWSYLTQQEQFLRAEFGRNMYAGPDRNAQHAAGAKAMSYFSGFLPGLGVSAETIPQIEAAYLELLDVLEVHFHSRILPAIRCRQP
jgi:glutathione S-transferase